MHASAVTAAGVLFASRLVAQAAWVPPQPPCDIAPGFCRLNSVPVNFRIAATQPNQRDHLLAQTLDVLTRSIRDDHQDKNPAAWYYLGRYYVETGNAAGADTAFAKAQVLAPQCKQDIGGDPGPPPPGGFFKGKAGGEGGRGEAPPVLPPGAGPHDPAGPHPPYQPGAPVAD